MKKTIVVSEEVKLSLDANGKFVEGEIPDSAYIMAHRDKTLDQEIIAVFDISGSQCKENIAHYIKAAKEFGITRACETSSIGSKPATSEIVPIDDYKLPKVFFGDTSLNFIPNIPINAIAMFFTDGGLDLDRRISRYKSTPVLLYVYDGRDR